MPKARRLAEQPCDIAHTRNRDQAIDFAHPDLAWTGSTQSCRSAVLCCATCQCPVSTTAFKFNKRMRAMPSSNADHVQGVTMMETIENPRRRERGRRLPSLPQHARGKPAASQPPRAQQPARKQQPSRHHTYAASTPCVAAPRGARLHLSKHKRAGQQARIQATNAHTLAKRDLYATSTPI